MTRDDDPALPLLREVVALLGRLVARVERPDWLTVQQAADELQVDRTTIYDAVSAGTLPALRIGRAVRISRTGLEELSRGPVRPSTPPATPTPPAQEKTRPARRTAAQNRADLEEAVSAGQTARVYCDSIPLQAISRILEQSIADIGAPVLFAADAGKCASAFSSWARHMHGMLAGAAMAQGADRFTCYQLIGNADGAERNHQHADLVDLFCWPDDNTEAVKEARAILLDLIGGSDEALTPAT